ncbi:MAG TPA: ABC transporter permease [Vicinamibacterales bacterium]|jgi:putative ABC transport system permease protein|nr:ABC transporter permease [Vicinamibacterales bacterium]
MLASFVQDLRYASRGLWRSPGFSVVALVTLALGVGLTTAIFGALDAVLLRPLPWGEPDRTVMIWSKWISFDKTWLADGEVLDYRSRSRTMHTVAAWSDGQTNVTGGGAEPERVAFAQATANIFDALVVRPVAGRTYTVEEDVPNGPAVAVISYELWQRRYGGEASTVGRSIELNGHPYQIVGIMPRGFCLPTDYAAADKSQVWVPLQIDPKTADHGSHGYYGVARLRAGATAAQATADLRSITQALTREGQYPREMQFRAFAVTLREEVVGEVRGAVIAVFAAVGFLLLIACANVANLLIVRAESRQREIAVRSALGAGRGRVLGQLVAEALVLALAGTAAGVALAYAIIRWLSWWAPSGIPRLAEATVDLRVMLFAAGLTIATAAFFSLAPALRLLGTDVTGHLKDGAQNATAGTGRQRFRSGLVVTEMALAVVLVIGAGLMLRSLTKLQQIDLGFDPSNVLTLRLSTPPASYDTPEKVVLFYQQLIDRVRKRPGVLSAGAARLLPLDGQIGDYGLMVDGYTPPPGSNAKGDWEIVTDGYIETVGERLVRGRTFRATDTSASQLVALVNEELARRYFAGRDPIGGRMRIGGDPKRPWVTIVGIVRDVRHNGVTAAVKEKFYVPHSQWHVATSNPIRSMSLVAKTAGNPLDLARVVREEVRARDPNLPVAQVRPMSEIVATSLSEPRFTSVLFGIFAGLALLLAAIGVYGVLSYLVTLRTREIGIRVAIGAAPRDVLWLILVRGFVLSLAGIAIGVIAAVPLGRLVAALLYEVRPLDPLTFGSVPLVLAGVALLAGLLPAWRAMRLDPVRALKTD